MNKIATVINFCTLDYKFLRFSAKAAASFSEAVIVPYADRLFDNTPEDQELIAKAKAENPEAVFTEFQYHHSITEQIRTRFWHNFARWVGIRKLPDDIDYVLFLDADEVVEPRKFLEFLQAYDLSQHDYLYFANYWYFREPRFRAKQIEDSPVMVKRSIINLNVIFHEWERSLFARLSNGVRAVMGLDGTPMFHHYSWVMNKGEMLRKVSTWGHFKDVDKDWVALINEEFSREFNGTDFIHGYQYKTVTPLIELNSSESNPAINRDSANTSRAVTAGLRSKAIANGGKDILSAGGLKSQSAIAKFDGYAGSGPAIALVDQATSGIHFHRNLQPQNILFVTNPNPNFMPDLLLHGLRKLLGPQVVDYPKKDCLYQGFLGLIVCPEEQLCPGWFPPDDGQIDREDIVQKVARGYFDLVICDARAADFFKSRMNSLPDRFAVLDGDDHPVYVAPGRYLIFRRETDGSDFSIPLPMALPEELYRWIVSYDGVPKEYSIGFLGSCSHAGRRELIDTLKGHYPDALFQASSIPSPEAPSPEGRLSRNEYYLSLQKCRMVLSMPGAGYDTFRFWENAACNAVHIGQHMPLFVPDDFCDTQHIFRFKGMDELRATIDTVLHSEKGWAPMIASSRDHLVKHHLTTERAKYFLDRVEKAYAR